MARVHYVKKARKANPVAKKGEPYYWWKNRTPGRAAGVKRYSKTQPRPSQVTASEFLSSCLAAQEDFEAGTSITKELTKDDAAAACRTAAEAYREIASSCEDKYGNLEQAFPGGCPTMELLEQRRDACETLADTLDGAADDIEALEEEPEPGEDEEGEGEAESLADQIEDVLNGVDWTFE
jgi:hypothetical protein